MTYPPCIRSLLLFALTAPLIGQEPPPGFEKPDHDIKMGVLPGRLRYDRERFSVAPGSKVKLTLINTDAMQHNLLICKPSEGVIARVAAAAMGLGAKASQKHYVPETSDVLFATKAIFFGQSDTIWFEAPEQPGEYPYVCTLPGHTFTMKGVMEVGRGGAASAKQAVPIENLRYRVYAGRWRKLPDFASLVPDREGELPAGVIDLGPLEEQSNFGAVFTGGITVEQPGRYTFFLNSDDGSRVQIDGEEVVAYDGVHGAAKEQKGKVELSAGHHQLRVEFFQGGGGQVLRLAFEGPGVKRRNLATAGPARPRARSIPISVHHHAVLKRVHVEGAAARTIAVGLPGGMNYCFDADRCCVQFGWAGAYLDVGPDREGRGGQPCKTLGPRFDVGNLGFPLRTAQGKLRAVRFLGYRAPVPSQPMSTQPMSTQPMPTQPMSSRHMASQAKPPSFFLDWGGTKVTWTISPAPTGVGLRYTFAMPDQQEDVQFVIRPDGLDIQSSAGSPKAGVLTVPALAAKDFSVTVRAKVGGAK